ncbi:MAG: repressor LexA [Candidatus Margulisbacteria bacterium GWF2_35_9]|nr:MAG: repressor LexA [Candidatus Margulisbacteria bacterium GWF2_35_9]
MKILHQVQKQLLDCLKANIDDPLTVRELQEELGISSPSVVQHHIQQLEKKGYLRRNPNNPRDYQVLTDSPDKQVSYLNLYGLAQCGPSGSIIDGNPIDRVPISSRILGFSATEAFMVKAKGDSMSPRINEGDLVIARKTSIAENGEIVVCVNYQDALIKKIQKQGDNIILTSINQKYDPFIANKEYFKIEGVVKSVLSYSI